MDIEERRRRWRAMMAVLWRHDAARWADLCLAPLYAAAMRGQGPGVENTGRNRNKATFRVPCKYTTPKAICRLQHSTAPAILVSAAPAILR